MVNKPKNIGTRAESAVVRYLRDNGFANCERRALRGSFDMGDVTGIPGVVLEVKGGDAARNASDNQIDAWLQETETERVNAAADIGLLVVARYRQPAERWWCAMTLGTMQQLMGYPDIRQPLRDRCVRTSLHNAAQLLRHAGWGETPETETT